jgi:ABC-type multidrug transport system ATPase subunit
MSDEDSTPARPASTPELREAGPWILVLAAASLAWWLTLPLAAWALGSSPRWWAPLAGGALVRQAVVPALRALASRRLRPLLSSLVAARALDSGAFESEPTVLAPIAQRLEGALVDAAPELLASSVGAAAFAIVAARALPTSWALATAFACAVAAGLRLAARPWLDASSDALLDAHRAEAHRLAGAARGRWEITGPARARFLEEARAIALRVARAEQVHHARLRAVRSAQLALFLAPLAWVLWTRARAGVPVTLRDQALVLPALAPLLAALRAVDALSHAQRALARLAVGAPRGGARTLPDAPIELRDVTVRYGDRLALDRVNLTLPARGITTVVGPNGAGKSTLARVLAGALAPSEGRCAAGGIALADVAPGDVAFVPQNPCIVESLSALDNVRLAAPDAAPAAVSAALAALGLPIALDRPASALSRGEQRRLAIARAVLRRPRLLVLDEPDAWLDLAGRADLAATLRHAAASCPVVLVTHRADLVEHDARVVVLSSAHTVEAEGPAAAVLATSPTARALLAAMPDESLRFAAEPGTRGG